MLNVAVATREVWAGLGLEDTKVEGGGKHNSCPLSDGSIFGLSKRRRRGTGGEDSLKR